MPPDLHTIEVDLPAVRFDVPAATDMLTVPEQAPPLSDAAAAIAQALRAPIGTPPSARPIRACSMAAARSSASFTEPR